MSQHQALFSEKIIDGVPWVVFSKSLLFIVYFLISVITVRYLGADQYGNYVLCKSIAEVLILICTLGMTSSYMRYIPELLLKHNKAGIQRLIIKASALQFVVVCMITLSLILGADVVAKLFSTDFKGALVFTSILIFFELIKTNVNAILTACYKIKFLTLFSVIHGLSWLALLFSMIQINPTVSIALIAPSISYAIIYCIAALYIIRYLRSLRWKSPVTGIGRRRVLYHSGSLAFSTIIHLLMLKYTELFFLGLQHDSSIVGLYDLAYSIPLMVIVFIPAAVQDLFVSGFSDAYVKDNSCLPELIRAFYKLLIILTVPLAVFGFFFSPQLFQIIYGDEISEAGNIASIFCLLHLLPLVSVPLSMAIQAKEKVINMLPTLLLQLLVNLILDYLFIIQFNWGLWGALAAVFLTFVLTIPIRLWVVKRILGGVFIPLNFFLKILFISLFTAYVLQQIISPDSLPFIVLLAPFYFFSIFIILNSTSVLDQEDKKDFQRLMVGKPQKFLNKIRYWHKQNIEFQR